MEKHRDENTPGRVPRVTPTRSTVVVFAVSIAAEPEDREVDCVGHLRALQ
jgi:hypothetical protein